MATKKKTIKSPWGIELLKLITENENYALWVAKLPDVALPVYAAQNKETEVIEMSTSVLANAKKMVDMLDLWLKNPLEEEVVGELPEIIPDPGMFS